MERVGKVAVVGAGYYGSTTAQRLAEYDVFDEVVLTDIIEGKPEGLALDINQSRPVETFETKVIGVTTGPNGSGYEHVAGSRVVIITAGLPRKPGMSRMDLIETNAKSCGMSPRTLSSTHPKPCSSWCPTHSTR